MVELVAGPELAAKDVEVVAERHGLGREGGKITRKEVRNDETRSD